MKTLCNFISRWMAALVLAMAVVAVFVPEPFASIPTKVINPMLGLIMFGMGLTISAEDFRVVFSRPRDVLIGCMAQYTVMPLAAWAISVGLGLPKELAIGVILVGCCPGGTASNVITYLAKGDLALSVGMTAVSTLIAPVMTPLLVLALAGTMVEVDTIGMLLSIVYVVIAPIAAGLLCQKFLPSLTKSVSAYLPAFSSIVIAAVVAIVVSHSAARLLSGGLIVIAAVVLHNLAGLAVGYGIARAFGMNMRKCAALSIEVGMQNSGLASALAVVHFAAFPLASVPGAIFSVWHNLSGALIAKVYAARCERQDG